MIFYAIDSNDFMIIVLNDSRYVLYKSFFHSSLIRVSRYLTAKTT